MKKQMKTNRETNDNNQFSLGGDQLTMTSDSIEQLVNENEEFYRKITLKESTKLPEIRSPN